MHTLGPPSGENKGRGGPDGGGLSPENEDAGRREKVRPTHAAFGTIWYIHGHLF